MPDKTLAEEYKLEEMKLLRGEVELRGQERRSMERNVLLADAAIYSFVLAPEKIDFRAMHRLGWLVWYLPPMLAFLALIRWRESLKMIGHLAEYIQSDRDQYPRQKWRLGAVSSDRAQVQKGRDGVPLVHGFLGDLDRRDARARLVRRLLSIRLTGRTEVSGSP